MSVAVDEVGGAERGLETEAGLWKVEEEEVGTLPLTLHGGDLRLVDALQLRLRRRAQAADGVEQRLG